MKVYTIINWDTGDFAHNEPKFDSIYDGEDNILTVEQSLSFVKQWTKYNVAFIILKVDQQSLITMLESGDEQAIKLAVEMIRNLHTADILAENNYEGL